MYSSLHKIDVVADTPDGPLCVQTDHRDQDEIEAQRELSVVFGLTRMLAPGFADPTRGAVRYACMAEAPPFLRDLVRACGATLCEHGATEPVEPRRPIDLDAVSQVAHDALMALGEQVLAREGLDPTLEGLRALEERLRDGEPLDVEDDEIRYYEAMVELAAAGGVVLARRVDGARWKVTERPISLVPLALEIGGGQHANVFGRSERFFEGDVEVGPSALSEVALREDAEDAPVVGVLKPAGWSWAGGHPVLSEPLLAGGDPGAAIPVILYGRDHPRAIAYLNPETSPLTVADARELAQAFYRQVEVEVAPLGGDVPLWLVTGDYYAPEKLLDRAFARALHARLEADTLLVGLAARGLAAVLPVTDDPRVASLTMKAFLDRAMADAPPSDRISAVPFLMVDGVISGCVVIEDEAPDPATPPRKKSFWKRLFGD